MRSRNLEDDPHDIMQTRLSRQAEGAASQRTPDSSSMLNKNWNVFAFTMLIIPGTDVHPFQWKSLVSTSRSSATTSSYFSDSNIYEAKLKAWAFDLAKLMATRGIAVSFGNIPEKLRTTAFFSRCGCGYVFSDNCKQRGHPFPRIFEEILSDIMPVAGVLSEEIWPNCANVTWYRNGYACCSVFIFC